MKINTLTFLFATLLLSCNSELKTEKQDSLIDNKSDKKEYERASQIIYSNTNSCLDAGANVFPSIDLDFDTIMLGDAIQGKVFFTSDYLRKLAVCNHLDYKIAFDVKDSEGRLDTSIIETHSDTLFFKIPYDSLKLVKTYKLMDEYSLNGNLRASYFKKDRVLGYDTMMPINKSIFIIKLGQKKNLDNN